VQPRIYGKATAAVLGVLCAAGFACNAVTGADGITFDDDDGGPGNTAATGSGVVSAGNTGGSTSAGPGVGGTSTAGPGPNASTGAGASNPCTYPSGPYGVAQGQVVPPTLSWQGYAPGSNTVTTITPEDLFDCDGSKGINAVMVDTSQYG
jgi:hypothetical protein